MAAAHDPRSVHPAPDRDGLRDVDHAHKHARAALDDPSANSLAAVTWASAHLASVSRVLHPVIAKTLPRGRELVARQSAVDRELQQALWRLDRRLTGDVHLSRAPVADLEEDVREALARHESGEARLVDRLREVLDARQQRELGERLETVLLRSPTRPHPHAGTRALPFWLDAVVDRVRDSMDNRDVPTPHKVVRPRRLGRWGAYLLGVPGPEEQAPR
jgi:hypothetical protein